MLINDGALDNFLKNNKENIIALQISFYTEDKKNTPIIHFILTLTELNDTIKQTKKGFDIASYRHLVDTQIETNTFLGINTHLSDIIPNIYAYKQITKLPGALRSTHELLMENSAILYFLLKTEIERRLTNSPTVGKNHHRESLLRKPIYTAKSNSPIHSGGYHEKYLKYKYKYLQLKNKLI